jgi:hypothetical protein
MSEEVKRPGIVALDGGLDAGVEEFKQSYDGADGETYLAPQTLKDGTVVYPTRGGGYKTWKSGYRASVGKTTKSFKFGSDISLSDLKILSDREPISHFLTWVVADNATKSWFRAVPSKGEDAGVPDPDVDNEFQEAFDETDAKWAMYEGLGYCLRDGWSIIVPLDDPQSELGFIFEAFEVENVGINWDRTHRVPKSYQLFRRVGDRGATRAPVGEVAAEHVIHLVVKPGVTKWQGKSELEVIYDDQTILRNMRWGMGQTLVRTGSGFPDITVKGKVDTDYLLEVKNQFLTDLSARTGFVHDEDIAMAFIGASGSTLNPREYHDPIVEHICAAKGIPRAILMGDPSGATASGEVNERGFFSVIESLQLRLTKYARQMMKYVAKEMGYPWALRPLKPQWLLRYTMSELDKQVIEGSRTDQLTQMMSYGSRREVRREAGYSEVPSDELKDRPEDDEFYATARRESGIELEFETPQAEGAGQRPSAPTGQVPSEVEQTVQGKEITRKSTPSRAGTHIHGVQHLDTRLQEIGVLRAQVDTMKQERLSASQQARIAKLELLLNISERIHQ